jgi:hypothetical protein
VEGETELRILAVLIGIVLLLPGFCSLVSLVAFGSELGNPFTMLVWLSGLALGGLGIWLIAKAGRKKEPIE